MKNKSILGLTLAVLLLATSACGGSTSAPEAKSTQGFLSLLLGSTPTSEQATPAIPSSTAPFPVITLPVGTPLITQTREPTLTPTATFTSTGPYPVKVTNNVTYSVSERDKNLESELDIYAPQGEGPWPIIIALHGAGGNKESMGGMGRELASMGALLFVPNWPDRPVDTVIQNNGRVGREIAEDLACVVRYARSIGGDLGGDTSWITLVGFSGGGTAGAQSGLMGDNVNAAWNAFQQNDGGPPSQVNCAAGGVSADVQAVVGIAGVYDVFDVDRPPLAKNVKKINPDLWQLLSPFALIGSNPDLRVRLIHGVQDPIAPIEAARAFLKGLLAAGYDADLYENDLGHSLPLEGEEYEISLQIILEAARP